MNKNKIYSYQNQNGVLALSVTEFGNMQKKKKMPTLLFSLSDCRHLIEYAYRARLNMRTCECVRIKNKIDLFFLF